MIQDPTNPTENQPKIAQDHTCQHGIGLCGPIFHVHAELADIRDFGHTPLGHRRVIDILGGRVDGPKLSGCILPGADWQIVWADGTVDLKARYGIETATGARVLVRSDGLRHGPADVLAALARGEPIDSSRYYFRTVMRFEAAIARGARDKNSVRLEVYEVL